VQRLSVQPLALAGDPIGHASAAMRAQPAPDQHQRAVIELALLDPVRDGLIIALHCPSRRVVLGSASQGVGKIGHRPLGAAHPTSPTPAYSPPGGRRSTPSCARSSAARSSSRSSRCAQTVRASLPPRRAPVRDDPMRDGPPWRAMSGPTPRDLASEANLVPLASLDGWVKTNQAHAVVVVAGTLASLLVSFTGLVVVTVRL
jgi:hypothetical protein